MQRDFELIRKLLIFFEEKADAKPVEVPDVGSGYTSLEVKYHLILLYQAGFLNCEALRALTGDRVISVLPFDLTWDGHEFLAKIRNENTWKKLRQILAGKGGTLAFSVINQLATKLSLEAVGLSS